MKLSDDQIRKYDADGYLLIDSLFDGREVALMLQEMQNVIVEDCPRRILEKSGSVRSFFAPEISNELYFRVTRAKRLVDISRQLLGEEVYIHQSKINSKYALVGDWWEWHQDYTYWKMEDRMPLPDVVTAMIFLNDVNEFNGPLLLIPGSHKSGTVDAEENAPASSDNKWFQGYQQSTSYMSALTADLKYTLKRNTIAGWVEKKGIVSAKGPAGSVLFFHGNIFHSSSNNLSPWDRHTFLVTFNSIRNSLPDMDNPRPAFIANRNFSPVDPLPGDRLWVTSLAGELID